MSNVASDAFQRPTALAVAPNGGRRTKSDHFALPLSAAELARTAAECLAAGCAMIHLHVRDRAGHHVLEEAAYIDAIDAIRRAVGDRILIQITSESLGLYSPHVQMAVAKAVRPEAVSLALRELAPTPESEPAFGTFLEWLQREGVMPQIILYAPDEARRLADMMQRGVIPFNDLPVLYVLGRYTIDQTSRPRDLLPFLAEDMPRFGHWTICAFGRHEAACATAAALMGGHMRVGFENNLLLPDGSTAPSNAALVATCADASRALGLRLATGDDLRAAWHSVLAG
jgi:uncharacterized protein (DUF849 family)